MTFYLAHAGGMARVAAPAGQGLATFEADALSLRAFNVGKGEAILMSRGRRGVLFDGGAMVKRTNAPLGRALVAYLQQGGIKLSALVATHPHIDHLNALSTLLAGDDPPSLAPGATLYHNGEAMGPSLRETLGERMDTLEQAGQLHVVAVPTDGVTKVMNGVRLSHVVGPRYKPSPPYRSIFTRVTYRDASLLFTGDAYTDYEEALLASGNGAVGPAHVLKVTHHGSQDGTGTPFVRAVQPRIAMASTGNDDGHRLEPSVRLRLARGTRGRVRVWDTYTADGDVIVRTDGRTRTVGGRKGVLYEVRVERPGWYAGGSW